MTLLVLVTVICTAAAGYALRQEAETATMLLTLGATYALLTAVALHRLWRDGTFVDKLKPRWGDVSIGLLVAAALVVAAWGVRAGIAPSGSPRNAWFLRALLRMGGPARTGAVASAAMALIGAAEEVVWRGLVLTEAEERVGTRRGWILAGLLYAVVLLPTVHTLRDPAAGYNPLLVIAGLGTGLVWSYLAARLGRLPPVIVSHVAFTYFVPTFLRP